MICLGVTLHLKIVSVSPVGKTVLPFYKTLLDKYKKSGPYYVSELELIHDGIDKTDNGSCMTFEKAFQINVRILFYFMEPVLVSHFFLLSSIPLTGNCERTLRFPRIITRFFTQQKKHIHS